MKIMEEMSTGYLDAIVREYITSQTKTAEEVLSACKELAKREANGADAAEIYRRHLYGLFPEDIKKDL